MANDINSVTVCGRLTRDLGSDPQGKDFKQTQGGMCIANISIAVNRSKKQGDQWVDEASFFNITIFGTMANNLKPYLTKGKQIVVQGHLHQDRWTDQEGKNHSSVSIVADNIQLIGGQNGNANGNVQQSNGYNPASVQQQQYKQRPQQQNFAPPNEGFPEDVPWN